MLTAKDGFEMIGEASDGDEAITQTLELQPDILLLDVQMPRLPGLEAMRAIMNGTPTVKILLLTSTITTQQIIEALHIGARGIVLKDAVIAHLQTAIRTVYSGDYWIAIRRVSNRAKRIALVIALLEQFRALAEHGVGRVRRRTLEPKRDAEIIRSLLNAFDEGGWLPKWPNPGYTNVMIGTHADSVIADAWTKGIHDFDGEKAYAALRKDATEPGTGRYEARNGIQDYIRLGWVPADRVKESASCTLEYAYDDFCVSRMARALGKTEDVQIFEKRSQNYRNAFDPAVGFMRGRNTDGSWVPFDELAWGGVYTEGNAWQWLWSVQHDVSGLTALLGGTEAFRARLDTALQHDRRLQSGRIWEGHPRDDRGQNGGHRAVRAHQRTGPPRDLPVRLRRPALEGATVDPYHHGQVLFAGSRRLAR